MAEGWEGVSRYRDDRREEVAKLRMDDSSCFHDKAKMLDCVRTRLHSMESKKKPEDLLSARVCQALVPDMLHRDGKHRLNSKDLWPRTKNLVSEASGDAVASYSQAQRAVDKDVAPDFQGLGIRRAETAQGPSVRSPGRPGDLRFTRHFGGLISRDRVESPRQMTFEEPGSDHPQQQRHHGKRHVSEPAHVLQNVNAQLHSWRQNGGATNDNEEVFRSSHEDLALQDESRGQDNATHAAGSRAFADTLSRSATLQQNAGPSFKPTWPSPPRYTSHLRNDSRIEEETVPVRTRSLPRGRPNTGKGKRPVPNVDTNTVREYMDQKRSGAPGAYLECRAELKQKLKNRDHVRLSRLVPPVEALTRLYRNSSWMTRIPLNPIGRAFVPYWRFWLSWWKTRIQMGLCYASPTQTSLRG